MQVYKDAVINCTIRFLPFSKMNHSIICPYLERNSTTAIRSITKKMIILKKYSLIEFL